MSDAAVKDQEPEVTETPEAVEIPAPPAADLVPSHPEDVYRALSIADERQIAQELQGRAVKAMIYSFPAEGGGKQMGLSWVGVREAVRQINTRGLGQIRVVKDPAPQFEDVIWTVDTGKRNDDGQPITQDRPAIRVTVYAEDEMHGGGNWGTATQLRHYKSAKLKDKNGDPLWFPDPFAATKALSKAERNAQEPFIPREIVEELFSLYQGKQGRVEYIPGVGRELPDEDRPPPLTDKRAKTQGDRIRALYDELKQVAGAAVFPPALFNKSFTAVQHDHERMDDFIKHLEQLITDNKKEKDGGGNKG